MVSRRELKLLLPRPVRRFPADLTVVVGLVAAALLAVWLPVVRESWLRAVLGGLFVLFVPGYAVVAALFPEKARVQTAKPEKSRVWGRNRRIGGVERVVLSLGTSLAIVPLIGGVLNFTPFGIRLTPIVVSVSVVTVVMAVVAAVRRWKLPPDERFRVRYDEWYASVRRALVHVDSPTDRALNVALALSLVLAVGTMAYAVASPKPQESYTEFYLLGENDGGELVADEYPTEFVQGEPQRLFVGVGNHERTQMNYTVVVVLQRVVADDGSTRVIEQEELHRFRVELTDGERWEREHAVRPTMTGESLRLQYMLFRENPPTEPKSASAYEETHLWVTVTQSGDPPRGLDAVSNPD